MIFAKQIFIFNRRCFEMLLSETHEMANKKKRKKNKQKKNHNYEMMEWIKANNWTKNKECAIVLCNGWRATTNTNRNEHTYYVKMFWMFFLFHIKIALRAIQILFNRNAITQIILCEMHICTTILTSRRFVSKWFNDSVVLMFGFGFSFLFIFVLFIRL